MNEQADETALVGPVDGTFCFKKRTDGSVNKSTVVCKLCKKEFAYHRSTSSLKYHLNAKHIAASVEASVDVSPTRSTRTHTQFALIKQWPMQQRDFIFHQDIGRIGGIEVNHW